MNLLLHPTYFPDIRTFAALIKYNVIWEVKDNYQKQTYRNRCFVCTDQGKHMLNIPIKHTGGKNGRQKYNDVLVDTSYSWQRQHWRTLATAYRSSPFFEFYEDDIATVFKENVSHLLEFNLKTIEVVCDCLEVPMPVNKTAEYKVSPEDLEDARFLVEAKNQLTSKEPYYKQVFGHKHSFIGNLSILDLLFNEGTNALAYLEKYNVPGIHD